MTNGAKKDNASPSRARRRWRWLVPAGCLGLTLIATACGLVITYLILSGMKNSGVYRDAAAAVEASPEARAALGSPIERGWWLMGSIHVTGPSGDADIVFPVSGPEGSGKLYAIGSKRAGEWTLELLELQVEGRDGRIDLLAGVD